MWESVWDGAPSEEQVALALRNTIFRVSVYDGEKPVAMARMIGDMGLNYYIKDVVVRPEYQRKGIGKMLIGELLKFVNDNGVKDTGVFVELCAVPDKVPLLQLTPRFFTSLFFIVLISQNFYSPDFDTIL